MIPDADVVATVPFGPYETWYRVTGDLDSGLAPLVVVHGGPGSGHDYLLSLSALARGGRPVIHYDQVGCGRSTHLRERGPEFWTVGLFLEEFDNLLDRLGIGAYHLLGQSWGGMLAGEHAVRAPRGLRSLVISNSPAAMDRWVAGTAALVHALPAPEREALERAARGEAVEDARVAAATQAFYDRHVCRVVPNPPEVLASYEVVADDPTVYHAMNGPNEFTVEGTLRTWSLVERLGEIRAPTLVISGRFDEATPEAVRPWVERVAGARWEVFAASSHMPFIEEPERYRAVVAAFVAAHD